MTAKERTSERSSVSRRKEFIQKDALCALARPITCLKEEVMQNAAKGQAQCRADTCPAEYR